MKLIIDIDENNYKLCKSLAPLTKEYISTVIGNGIPYEERPQGEWNYIQADMCVCPFCGAMPHKLYKDYCAKCGAYLKGGAE